MQHLNLYSQLARAVEPPFSARQQLWAMAAVVVVMVVMYSVLLVGERSLQEELEQLQQQQQSISVTLDELKARKARLEKDETLNNEIAMLRSDIKFRRQLLATIDPNTKVMENGFADHLGGLARQQIEGMWFTEIQLLEGGQQLALIGRTLAPEYVPRFLQKLATEEIFEGHQFRVFRMNIPAEQKHLLDFELRANEVGLP